MTHTFILLLILLFACMYIFTSKTEEFSNLYLAQPTKCVDCEAILPPGKKYLGGPTKCFDCEQQMLAMNQNANWGHNTKCFDCERQMM